MILAFTFAYLTNAKSSMMQKPYFTVGLMFSAKVIQSLN